VQLYDWPRGQGPVGIDKSSDRNVHRQVCVCIRNPNRSLSCMHQALCVTLSRAPARHAQSRQLTTTSRESPFVAHMALPGHALAYATVSDLPRLWPHLVCNSA
jgi:hypothetical protein